MPHGSLPKSLNLTFVGGGKIAQAMLNSLVHQGNNTSKLVIRAVDPSEKRLLELRKKGVFQVFPKYSEEISKETDVMVLAVKPQQAGEAMKTIAKHPLRQSSVFVSVVAGLTLRQMGEAQLGTNAIVRAMPNTPATIGKGMTVWLASPETDPKHYETVRWLLRASK